ncbi:MAG: lysophospholipid acyltransferase family protein [Perlucidibaca sp.]
MTDSNLAFKDRLSIALLRLFSRLPLPLLQRLGAWIGALASRMRDASHYRTVHRNIELCFPERDNRWHDTMTRAALISTGMTAMEFAKTWHMPPEYSIALIREAHGADFFHAALAEGKGVIGIIPHWGSWEFMNAWVNQYTAPIIMYKPGKQPGVNAMVTEARSRLRATTVPTDESGVRATFKELRRGGFTAILPDHIPGENGGVFAPFFGIPTWTGVIVPKLAARTGCRTVIMGCLRRQDGQGFDLHFLPGDPDIGHEDPAVAATAMNRAMEELIRIAPEQYQWTYKRFKRNLDLADPYQR